MLIHRVREGVILESHRGQVVQQKHLSPRQLILIFSGRVTDLALRISSQMNEMRGKSVSCIERPNRFSTLYAFKTERTSFSTWRGVSNCQSLFNRNNMTKKFTLVCHSHCSALHLRTGLNRDFINNIKQDYSIRNRFICFLRILRQVRVFRPLKSELYIHIASSRGNSRRPCCLWHRPLLSPVKRQK